MSLLWKTATSQPEEDWDDYRDPFEHIPVPDNPCCCEHIDHIEHPNEAMHPYLRTPAGGHECRYVGPVCDDCAHGHLSGYVCRDPSHGHLVECPDCP